MELRIAMWMLVMLFMAGIVGWVAAVKKYKPKPQPPYSPRYTNGRWYVAGGDEMIGEESMTEPGALAIAALMNDAWQSGRKSKGLW